MASRLTRREMKRDEVLETASRFFSYITEHTRGLVLVLLAVLALVLVGVGVYAYLESREERANESFARALAAFNGDIVVEEANPEDPTGPTFSSSDARDLRAQELFQSVDQDFGSTSVGELATVYLGSLAMRRGDTASAREFWESFIAADPDHMLGTEVRLNLLAMDRAEGRGDEVVAALREQLGSPSPDFPLEVALDQLGAAYAGQGRVADAEAVFRQARERLPYRKVKYTMNIAVLAQRTNRSALALSELESVLPELETEVDPAMVRVYFYLGELYRAEGRAADARRAYETYLRRTEGVGDPDTMRIRERTTGRLSEPG